MAYQVEFGPTAHQQIARLDLTRQRRVLQHIEQEARDAAPEGDRQKRLRRTRVDDLRLVFLEVHPQQRILVLKVAGPEDLRRWVEPDMPVGESTPDDTGD